MKLKLQSFLLQGGGDDNKVSEMEAKLQQMQEEMRKMQEQLSAAKNSQSQKTLEEIDVFQVQYYTLCYWANLNQGVVIPEK